MASRREVQAGSSAENMSSEDENRRDGGEVEEDRATLSTVGGTIRVETAFVPLVCDGTVRHGFSQVVMQNRDHISLKPRDVNDEAGILKAHRLTDKLDATACVLLKTKGATDFTLNNKDDVVCSYKIHILYNYINLLEKQLPQWVKKHNSKYLLRRLCEARVVLWVRMYLCSLVGEQPITRTHKQIYAASRCLGMESITGRLMDTAAGLVCHISDRMLKYRGKKATRMRELLKTMVTYVDGLRLKKIRHAFSVSEINLTDVHNTDLSAILFYLASQVEQYEFVIPLMVDLLKAHTSHQPCTSNSAAICYVYLTTYVLHHTDNTDYIERMIGGSENSFWSISERYLHNARVDLSFRRYLFRELLYHEQPDVRRFARDHANLDELNAKQMCVIYQQLLSRYYDGVSHDLSNVSACSKLPVCCEVTPQQSFEVLMGNKHAKMRMATSIDCVETMKNELKVVHRLMMSRRHLHNNVVRLLLYQDNTYPHFYITETNSNDRTLQDHLRLMALGGSHWMLKQRVSIAHQCLGGISFCLDRRVVLLDLTPPNFLIFPRSSQDVRVKLKPVGKVRDVNVKLIPRGPMQIAKNRRTHTGDVSSLGEVPLLESAPETLLDPYRYGESTVAYSIGCLLQIIFTFGNEPHSEWEAPTQQAKAMEIAAYGIEHEKPATVPSSLFQVYTRLMSMAPQSRIMRDNKSLVDDTRCYLHLWEQKKSEALANDVTCIPPKTKDCIYAKNNPLYTDGHDGRYYTQASLQEALSRDAIPSVTFKGYFSLHPFRQQLKQDQLMQAPASSDTPTEGNQVIVRGEMKRSIKDFICRLGHKNLRKVLEIICRKHTMLFTFEPAAPGFQILRSALQNGAAQVDMKTLTRILMQVAEGVDYLHKINFCIQYITSKDVHITGDLRRSTDDVTAKIICLQRLHKLTKTDYDDCYSSVQNYIPEQHLHIHSEKLRYMSREYLDTGSVSLKGDVYSFAMLIMDVLKCREVRGSSVSAAVEPYGAIPIKQIIQYKHRRLYPLLPPGTDEFFYKLIIRMTSSPAHSRINISQVLNLLYSYTLQRTEYQIEHFLLKTTPMPVLNEYAGCFVPSTKWNAGCSAPSSRNAMENSRLLASSTTTMSGYASSEDSGRETSHTTHELTDAELEHQHQENS